MIDIFYKQACIRKKKSSINGRYFYVQSHDRAPTFFEDTFELPEGHLFSLYSAIYDYEHLQSIDFFILQAGGANEQIIYRSNGQIKFDKSEFDLKSRFGLPFVAGNFKIICYGRGKTYGKRLLEWWLNGDYSIEYAELCAKYLKPRVKQIPQFELDKLSEPQPQATDAVLSSSDTAFQKWLSTAAVLGGKEESNK